MSKFNRKKTNLQNFNAILRINIVRITLRAIRKIKNNDSLKNQQIRDIKFTVIRFFKFTKLTYSNKVQAVNRVTGATLVN